MRYSQQVYADMSKAAYATGKKRNVKGFQIDEHNSSPDYVTYVDDKDGHAVVAFRGTSRIDRGDLEADVMIALGTQRYSPRFMWALNAVRVAKTKYGANDVEVTGHSLGGSEAMYVSSQAKVPAVTFNAGVSPIASFFDYEDYSQVTAVYDENDIVSSSTKHIPSSTNITRINSSGGEPTSDSTSTPSTPSGNVSAIPPSQPSNSNLNSNSNTASNSNSSAAIPAPNQEDKSGGSSGGAPMSAPPPRPKKKGFWKTLGQNLKQDAKNVGAGLSVIGTDIAKHPFEAAAVGVGIIAAGVLTGGAAFGVLGEAAGEYAAVATEEAIADTVVDTVVSETTPLLEDAAADTVEEETVNLPYYGSQYAATAAPEGTSIVSSGAANYVGAGLGAAGVAAGTGTLIAASILGQKAVNAASSAHAIPNSTDKGSHPNFPEVTPAAPSDPLQRIPGVNGNPDTITYRPPDQTTTSMVPEIGKNGKPTGKMVKKTTTVHGSASSSTYYAPQYDLTGGLSHTHSRHQLQNATHYHKRGHREHHRRHPSIRT